MDRQLKQFPEVERVFGKVGRSTSATDPAPLLMVGTVVTLKPRDQWREGLRWDDLITEMDEKLRYPGMTNIWWMPIQTDEANQRLPHISPAQLYEEVQRCYDFAHYSFCRW